MSSVSDALLSEFRALELVRDRPVRRDLSSLNVEPGWKARFEALRAILSVRVGRPLTQWEAFAIVVAEVEERYAFELAAARGR